MPGRSKYIKINRFSQFDLFYTNPLIYEILSLPLRPNYKNNYTL